MLLFEVFGALSKRYIYFVLSLDFADKKELLQKRASQEFRKEGTFS